jgi:hypothetical protein
MWYVATEQREIRSKHGPAFTHLVLDALSASCKALAFNKLLVYKRRASSDIIFAL